MRKYLNLILLLGALGQVACAERLATWAVDVERWRSSLVEKKMSIGDIDIAYLEGGQGPTIFLIHGFAADKENWTRFARKFTDQYHVIALDLPGFGDSSRVDGLSYGPKPQAERLDKFRAALGIDKVHVVGNSMGGMIAGVFAHDYQAHVLSLTLIDSAGVASPDESELIQQLRKGYNPLLVDSLADMDRLLAFIFVNPPYIPGAVKAKIYERGRPYKEWNKKIFAEIAGAQRILEPMLPELRIPVQVIWGDKDRVIDVSAVRVIKKLRPDAEVSILKDCGHAPMLEQVDEAVRIYSGFLDEHFKRQTLSFL